ncbi:glycosyltransferase [SAR116 cluster alpha proteobacterium HIMB100]|nr:glycosyltransferase [SAR116 cluster alpha proteobacterium HIMB100]
MKPGRRPEIWYVSRTRIDAESAQAMQVNDMLAALHHHPGLTLKATVAVRKDLPVNITDFAVSSIRSSLLGKTFYIYFAFRFVCQILASTSPQAIVYSRDILNVFFALLFGLRAVYEMHQPLRSKASRVLFRLSIKIWPHKFKVVVISGPLSAYLENEFMCPGEKILVAHDGVDINWYECAKAKSSVSYLREQEQIPKDIKIIMHTGSIYKGGIGAVLDVLSRYPQFWFVHIGGTKEDCSILQQKAQLSGLSNISVFPQKAKDTIPAYHAQSDFLIYIIGQQSGLSRYTSPLKLFEYMVSGQPVIYASTSSVDEVITPDFGYDFIPDDIGSLNAVFEKVLSTPTEGRKKAAASYDHVSQQYTWHHRVSRICDMIKNWET